MAQYNNDHYLMTCAHTLGDCGEDYAGVSVYSGSSHDYIGDVFIYSWDYDWALVSPDSVNGLDNHIMNESKRLLGHKTSSGCDTLISNYDTTYHEGVSSGRTRGWLDEKVTRDFTGCDSYSAVEYLRHGTEAGEGDSGGPHFHDTGGSNVVLLGPHSSHTSTGDIHQRSFGPAAYAINDQSSIDFGGTGDTC